MTTSASEPRTGEDTHDLGSEGLQRAKVWLDLTTRVYESWTHRDRPNNELIKFWWPHGAKRSFSFDLGGKFRGGHLEKRTFLAEVKNYKNESDLPDHFRDFLAKCYVALDAKPDRCDTFLWISWSPFQARQWDQHATTASVRNAVTNARNRKRVLGVDKPEDAMAKLSDEMAAEVARRIWLITLSEQQEKLVITGDHYHKIAEIFSRETGL
jgi:hypothetical protein